MTVRSVILGLLGAVAVCSVTYLNDHVLRQSHVVGNHMPVSVYGILILFVWTLNRWLRRWSLTGGEIAVILALVLAACCIPGSGLLRTFTASLMMPHHYNRTEAAWRGHRVIEAVPKKMLADISAQEDEVLGGYLQGLSEGSGHIAPGRVPWHAWTRTFLFWIPLVLTLLLALLCLSVVLHRQWSRNEHLPYPVAAFTDALLPEEGKGGASVFGSRLFWIALVVVMGIHLNNYLTKWFPEYLIPISIQLDFMPLRALFPFLSHPGGGFVFRPIIYFTVIGIAFLISTDVAAAFGLGPYLWAIVAGIFLSYGVSLDAPVEGVSTYTGLTPRSFLLFGSCAGMFLALLYTGRHYYVATLGRAFALRVKGETDIVGVWGLRAFFLLGSLFTLQLCLTGIGWPFALLYFAFLVITHTIMSRVIAEGGLFHMQLNVFPCMVIWGLFGAASVGPKALLIMQIVTMALIIDPREALMPFVANALKLLELRKAAIGRVSIAAGAAVVLGLAVALPVTLYIQYDMPESLQNDTWAYDRVPKMPFNNVVQVRQRLTSVGACEAAESMSTWERLGAIRPNGPCTIALVAGLALVLVCAAGRLRFASWPIHPMLFVLWTTWHARHFAFSFMLGWAVKGVVMRYGGSGLYNKLKPLMLGLIAGEVLGALVPGLAGAVYFMVTGEPPASFRVMPG